MQRFMQFMLTILVAGFFAILGESTTLAQSKSQDPGLWDKLSKAVQGESQQKTYVNNRTSQKVSVTIKDLSWADMAAYSSVKEAFGSNWASSNLVVNEISFSPDFSSGYYALSFSLPERESTKVVLLDVAGNELHSEVIEDFTGSYETRINVPAAQKGTYFLKIIQGFNLLNKKLVIE